MLVGADPSLPEDLVDLVGYPLPVPGNNTVPMWFVNLIRLAYYSAVTVTDHHMGQVLRVLDRSKAADDTLVVVVG